MTHSLTSWHFTTGSLHCGKSFPWTKCVQAAEKFVYKTIQPSAGTSSSFSLHSVRLEHYRHSLSVLACPALGSAHIFGKGSCRMSILMQLSYGSQSCRRDRGKEWLIVGINLISLSSGFSVFFFHFQLPRVLLYAQLAHGTSQVYCLSPTGLDTLILLTRGIGKRNL